MAELDLTEIRQRLDAIDTQLVDVLVARTQLINEVIAFKRANGMAVVDRSREDEMMERIGQLAEARGLDARIARQVLRAVIDSFTLLEVEHLGDDS
jgi:chorismate mutase